MSVGLGNMSPGTKLVVLVRMARVSRLLIRRQSVVGVAMATLAAAALVVRPASSITVPTVSCESIVLQLDSGRTPWMRVVLGSVSVPRQQRRQVNPTGQQIWPYFAKFVVSLLGGSPPADIALPKAWRKHVKLGWGEASGSSVRFLSCPSYSPKRWNGYAGGAWLKSRSACVPLIVRVGNRQATIRVALGRSCG